MKALDLLLEISHMHTLVSSPLFLETTQEPVNRWNPSRPPCSTYVLSVLDPRTVYRRPGDPLSPLRVLRAWSHAVAEARCQHPLTRTVDQCVTYLIYSLHWIEDRPAYPRFVNHMRACHRQLTKIAGS